jgi:hypothetical protein
MGMKARMAVLTSPEAWGADTDPCQPGDAQGTIVVPNPSDKNVLAPLRGSLPRAPLPTHTSKPKGRPR